MNEYEKTLVAIQKYASETLASIDEAISKSIDINEIVDIADRLTSLRNQVANMAATYHEYAACKKLFDLMIN